LKLTGGDSNSARNSKNNKMGRKKQKAQSRQEVWIFYSARSDSGLLSLYREGIDYLKEAGIENHVIDVNERPDLAEKYNVMATPLLLIKRNNVARRYVGIVDGLRQFLKRDLYGRIVLGMLDFKEGRAFVKELEFVPMKREKIEEVLNKKLKSIGIHNFSLVEFNVKEKYAKVRLRSELPEEYGKSKKPVCFEIANFLGGIFMEFFGEGVAFKETQCMAQGRDYCEFEIQKAGIYS